MIEIIKAIIEPIAKAISVPELLKSHKDKKAHEIGTELFVMYASLNEILVVGRSIVSELESGTEWMSRKLKEGKPQQTESIAHAVADHVIYQERDAFEHLIRREEIDDVGMIPAHQYPVIRAYLDHRKPSATLDDIEALLLVFRRSIEENFSLHDILLKVGDHRASLREPGMSF